MAEANNPYVVNLLEFNEEDGIPYMVLEFVAGRAWATCWRNGPASTRTRPSRSWRPWHAA